MEAERRTRSAASDAAESHRPVQPLTQPAVLLLLIRINMEDVWDRGRPADTARSEQEHTRSAQTLCTHHTRTHTHTVILCLFPVKNGCLGDKLQTC